ncbi:DUF6522 family protein [Paracoccus pacificus]|uniref:DUF6522 family protein n=1 Tax=Paracoccus pacificus TaxID=1463598 RepID=A0ABW4R9S6_9RHOB
MKLEVRNGQITVDAQELAPLLDLHPAEFQKQMQAGRIATMTEQGEGADSGRFRVTFRSDNWRLRLTCAEDGTVLSQVRTPAPAPPASAPTASAPTAPGRRPSTQRQG